MALDPHRGGYGCKPASGQQVDQITAASVRCRDRPEYPPATSVLVTPLSNGTALTLPFSIPTAVGAAVKSPARPPGRIYGQRWVTAPLPTLVNGCGLPPASGARERPDSRFSAATIVPSSPQVAP